uniref:Uncharacterized protein n=1 Tax=Ditylenchus dipsaci TaxID=166011 RepID=A0A915EAJ8_9BILA
MFQVSNASSAVPAWFAQIDHVSDEKLFAVEEKLNKQNLRIIAKDISEASAKGRIVGRIAHPKSVMSGIKPAVLPIFSQALIHNFNKNIHDLKYYDQKFDIEKLCNIGKDHTLNDLLLVFFTTIVIHLKERISIEEKLNSDADHGSPIYIEEPFTHLNTAIAVEYGPLYFFILENFSKSFEEFYVNKDLDLILSQEAHSQFLKVEQRT